MRMRLAEIYLKAERRWFTKRYIKRQIRIADAKYKEQLGESRKLNLTPIERYNSEGRIYHDVGFDELFDWLRDIEDHDLVKRAKRIGLDLEDISFPEPEQFQKPGIWKIAGMGFEHLYDESRKAVAKQVREREPVYRKERRDGIQFYANLLFATLGFIVALVALIIKR
jgi:hypothetical protein